MRILFFTSSNPDTSSQEDQHLPSSRESLSLIPSSNDPYAPAIIRRNRSSMVPVIHSAIRSIQSFFSKNTPSPRSPLQEKMRTNIIAGATLYGLGRFFLPKKLFNLFHKTLVPGSSFFCSRSIPVICIEASILTLFTVGVFKGMQIYTRSSTSNYNRSKKKVYTAILLPPLYKSLFSSYTHLPLKIILPHSSTTYTAVKVTALVLFYSGAKDLLTRAENREILQRKIMKNIFTERGFKKLPPMFKSFSLIGFALLKILFPEIPLPTYYLSHGEKMRLIESIKRENLFAKAAVSALFTREQKIQCLKEGKFSLAALVFLFLLGESSTFRKEVNQVIKEHELSLLNWIDLPQSDTVMGLDGSALNIHLILPAYLYVLKKELARKMYPDPLHPSQAIITPIILSPCQHLVDGDSMQNLFKDPKYSSNNPLCPICKIPIDMNRDKAGNISLKDEALDEEAQKILNDLNQFESTPPFSLIHSVEELGEIPQLIQTTTKSIEEFQAYWSSLYERLFGQGQNQ